MTADDFIAEMTQRNNARSDNNPFKPIIAKRLAKLGGLHRPPDVADEAAVQRDEVRVAVLREVAQLESEGPSCPF
ncbi:MAG: hypothetical protein AAFV43_11805 [Planctomycetota bacterium]